jgi:hypothetical protein
VSGVVGIWLGFYGGLTEMVWILCYDGDNCISVWLEILWMETGWANCWCFWSFDFYSDVEGGVLLGYVSC